MMAISQDNIDWLLSHGHDLQVLPSREVRVRIYAKGAKRPSVEVTAPTSDEAIRRARAALEGI